MKVPKSSKFDLKNALKSLKEGDTKIDENLNKHNDTFVCVAKPRYDKHFNIWNWVLSQDSLYLCEW